MAKIPVSVYAGHCVPASGSLGDAARLAGHERGVPPGGSVGQFEASVMGVCAEMVSPHVVRRRELSGGHAVGSGGP